MTRQNNAFFIPVLVVVGPGLIGGSVAAALKQAGCVGKVIGVSRQPSTTAQALHLGLIDEIADLVTATQQADVILQRAKMELQKIAKPVGLATNPEDNKKTN